MTITPAVMVVGVMVITVVTPLPVIPMLVAAVAMAIVLDTDVPVWRQRRLRHHQCKQLSPPNHQLTVARVIDARRIQ
jgi:hypothetical protein